MSTDSDTHFGFSTVPISEKQGLVDDVFHKVASRYDLMNDLMSAGLHRPWKEALVTQLNPPRGSRPFRHLDVAGGTGDIAFRVLEAGGPATHVTVLDINEAMLTEGRRRADGKHHAGALDFVQANAESLPFPTGHFDGYTIAFGIRNVPRIDMALREAHRVLKRGGHFLCLEFSAVDVPLLDRIYDAYSLNVIPPLGRAVTGDGEPYRYLVESIRRFPKAEAFATMIREAEFGRVSFRMLTGGIAAIHSGWKL
jgi:demethylmenaquinone methyltransferase/2-methoxy-6-polyprenyl-1,4-benzoquinol methylase